MKQISFHLTQDSFQNESKDITRRDAWNNLKAGDVLMGVNQCQGLKKGEQIKFHPIVILRVQKEPLEDIVKCPFRDGRYEVEREGFPAWVGKEEEFIHLYLVANGGDRHKLVNRIEFKKVTCHGSNANGFCAGEWNAIDGKTRNCPAQDISFEDDIAKGAKLCRELQAFYNKGGLK